MENVIIKEKYIFKCGRWLVADEDDYFTVREMSVEGFFVKKLLVCKFYIYIVNIDKYYMFYFKFVKFNMMIYLKW